MRPEQEVAAVLHILLNTRSCILGYIREIPDVVHIACLDVAQPEEHAIVLDISNSVDVSEVNIFALRIVLVEPQPCAGLVVVTVGNEFFRCSIF